MPVIDSDLYLSEVGFVDGEFWIMLLFDKGFRLTPRGLRKVADHFPSRVYPTVRMVRVSHYLDLSLGSIGQPLADIPNFFGLWRE